MKTIDLIEQIKLLVRNQRFYTVEKTLKSVRKEKTAYQTETAVEALYGDYSNNKELAAFYGLKFGGFL